MARILFVEDNLTLIDEIVALLIESDSTLEFDYATDIGSAMKCLEKECDLVVADVMLPGYSKVPSKDEGIYLAAWILEKEPKEAKEAKEAKKPKEVKALPLRQRCPLWMIKKPPKIVLLTSRTASGVEDELVRLMGKKSKWKKSVRVVGRLTGDAWDHCKAIQAFLKKGRE